ncbi:MAG: OAM dimerization domain-containing protein [bacterium]
MINRGNQDRGNNRSGNKGHDTKRAPYTGYDDLKEKMPTEVKAYGDHRDDGAIQLSFTLPMPCCEEAKIAAQTLVEKMGFQKVNVIYTEAMGPCFTFFVVYGCSDVVVDLTKIEVPKLDFPNYSYEQVNGLIKEKIGRKLVVLGACIGTDAHTVGIDAIFNMKGYMGDYGLERYTSMQAINLRAQVSTKQLIEKIVALQADAVLISRVVTQRDEHIDVLKEFIQELEQEKEVASNLIKICGGPRISHQLAKELGFDAGFGPGTKPSHVASYIADESIKRLAR